MKIRQGFVSNSSSSSFCIVGIYNDFFNIPHIISEHKEEIEKEFGSYEEYEDNQYDYFDHITSKSKLEHLVSWECESYYTGMDIRQMKDEETLLQFKERVANEMNKECGTNYTASDMIIINDTIYN